MKIKLWGIRGSLPAPLTADQMAKRLIHFLEKYQQSSESKSQSARAYIENLSDREVGGFGGHTTCIEVATPQTRLILDGGSGLRPLGDQLMKESSFLGRGEVHILMTHFHWDHLMGLPFFVPIFVPGNQIHFYAVQDDLEENIRRIFTKPNFPVPFDQLSSKIKFHKLQPRKPRTFGDVTVTPYQLDHPDPCWGFRIEHGGRVFSHCVDSECTRVSREQLGLDLPLYQNVDLMTFDAQYTFLEATERVHWGHASGPIGIDLAMREKVKRVLFIHHDPAAPEEKILRAEMQTREYYEAAVNAAKAQGNPVHEVDWGFAHESMEVLV